MSVPTLLAGKLVVDAARGVSDGSAVQRIVQRSLSALQRWSPKGIRSQPVVGAFQSDQ